MKAKKVLAVALATAMAFSALPGMTVKAGDVITGGTVYVGQDVIDVILPTTASQEFYIDPQGLIALGEGGAEATGAGVVTGKNDMYAVNKSSMPLALSVNYKLVDSGDSVSIATDAATAATVKDATGMAIAVSLKAEAATEYVNGTATGAATGDVFVAGDNGLASGTGVTMTPGGGMTDDEVYASAEGTEESYFMTAQTYKFQLKSGIATGDATKIHDSNSYEYVIDPDENDASCVKLTIGGNCAKDADWSDYAKGTQTLKLDVTFKFKKLTNIGTNKYYLEANAAEVEGGASTPSTPSSGAGYLTTPVSASNLALKPNLPTGVTVSTIMLKCDAVNSGAETQMVGGGKHFTSSNGTYTFKSAMITAWSGGTLTFNYSDGTKDVVTIQ